MDLGAVGVAFATVFVAELPDKTMVATVVLAARFGRPIPVWVGAVVALATQMAIATAAGGLIGRLPDRLVSAVVAVLFAVGAVLLWRTSAEPEELDEVTAAQSRPAPTEWWRVPAAVFAVVFVAEWGDLTQLATASLASQRHALSVLVGAVAAMATVAAIGVTAGRALLRVLPEHVLRRVAAVIFAVLAVVAVIDALRS